MTKMQTYLYQYIFVGRQNALHQYKYYNLSDILWYYLNFTQYLYFPLQIF